MYPHHRVNKSSKRQKETSRPEKGAIKRDTATAPSRQATNKHKLNQKKDVGSNKKGKGIKGTKKSKDHKNCKEDIQIQ
jgi:hypothetical protein